MASWQELTQKEFEALPTKRLYNIYRIVQRSSGYANYHLDTSGRDLTPTHKKALELKPVIKEILDGREHIDREVLQ